MVDQSEEEKRRVEINIEHAKRAHDLNRQMSAAFSRAAIEAANMAIRSLILINGGAVVALLAFLGALESGGAGDSVKSNALVDPIEWFALGVGFAATTAVAAYLVNLLDDALTDAVKLTWEHPYVVPDKKHPSLRCLRSVFHLVAMGLAAAALYSFFRGIGAVAEAVTSLNI